MAGKKEGFWALIKRLFIILLIIFILLVIVMGYFLTQQKNIIENLEDRIELVSSSVIPLRFMVLSRDATSIAARFRFYDGDGAELSSFERSWIGSELAIDSLVVPVANSHLVFPVRIFTDALAPKKGTPLFPFYDQDGFPAIFDSASLNTSTRRALSKLFQRLKLLEGFSGNAEPGQENAGFFFGNAVHDLQYFRRFKLDTIYALVVHPDGGIELIEE